MTSRIDSPDATAAARPFDAWDDQHSFSTTIDVSWQFDYEACLDKLDKLYDKAKSSQWNADEVLDWDYEIDPSKPLLDEQATALMGISVIRKLSDSQRETFNAHYAAQILSQFLHGEQGALMTSAACTLTVPDHDAKLYAATQTVDEARHVEVYDRYIKKVAITYPMSPWLKQLIDATLSSGHYIKVMIGMNMVVEGLALASFHNMRRQTTCPLLQSLTGYVLRDESRHVAFGNVYLGEKIAALHPDEREDIAEFAFEAVKILAEAQGGADGSGRRAADPGFAKVLDTVGIDRGDFMRSLRDAGASGLRAKLPPGHVHSFRDLMMPALVRVGAVTDRSRELYAAADIPIWDDLHVLESMEDAGTGDIVFPD